MWVILLYPIDGVRTYILFVFNVTNNYWYRWTVKAIICRSIWATVLVTKRATKKNRYIKDWRCSTAISKPTIQGVGTISCISVLDERTWKRAGAAPLTHALHSALPWSRQIDPSWDAPGIEFNIHVQGFLLLLSSATELYVTRWLNITLDVLCCEFSLGRYYLRYSSLFQNCLTWYLFRYHVKQFWCSSGFDRYLL